MNIWLLKANEPMPATHPNQRLFRMGYLAEELVKQGHNVRWFTTTFEHIDKVQLYNKDKEIKVKEGYIANLIWSPKYKKNISLTRAINHKYFAYRFLKIAEQLKKPDLIFVALPTINFAEVAIKYGEKHNVPVIIDIRDLWPDIFKHNLSKLKYIIAYPYIKLMEYKTNKIMKKAYAITAKSPAIVEWGLKKARREKSKTDKAFYIGYARTCEEIERKELLEGTFKICFAGTLINQYQFNIMIDTAKLLEGNNIEFLICGDGPYYKVLQEMVVDMKNVKLLGMLEKECMEKVLQECQVGFAPYRNSFDFQMGITNKIPEYLSYSLPTILTVEGDMTEFVKKHECGFFSLKPEKIKEYILGLKNNKEVYENTAQNAQKAYQENFRIDLIYPKFAQYLNEIYENLDKEGENENENTGY